MMELVGNKNYAASIVRLKILNSIPKADRIQQAVIYGNSVIVSKDSKEGDLGVFFPVECQLSEAMVGENNLYRHPEWGNKDKDQKGYFDQNRRVKCVKMRGIKSEGIWLPISSLSWVGNIGEIAENVEFDSINGQEICRKYVSRRNPAKLSRNQKAASKAEDKIVDGQFRYHIDTSNLRRNSHNVKPNDTIRVTWKMHGCLLYQTRLTMADGSKVPIGKVVSGNRVGEYVLGVDGFGNLVPSKILNVFRNGSTREWVKVTVERRGKGGANESVVRCTPNHRFYANGEYIEARSLQVGDKVCMLNRYTDITPLQKSVLLGKMLGDGSIVLLEKTASIYFGHNENQLDYLHWTKKCIGQLDKKTVQSAVSGYGSSMYRSATIYTGGIYNEFNSFIKGGVKVIPEWVAESLDPISIAFWYMDDGSLAHSDKQRDRACFAVCSFTEEDCSILIKGLSKYGIRAVYYKHDGYSRIRLNADCAEKLFLLISPYIHPSMQYKLPERFRSNASWIPADSYMDEKTVTTESKVISVEHYESDSTEIKYDIQTETGNFFASDVLVHNSSAVFGNLLVKRELPWYEKVLKYLGVKVETTQYGFVWSSRRVIKGIEDPKDGSAHYYKTDVWGDVGNRIKHLIPPGYTLYGEIVGYTSDGSPIQSLAGDVFDYGCDPGQNEFYVYRITVTSKDGDVIELNDSQIRQFCDRRGIKVVPLIYHGRMDELVFDAVEWGDSDYDDNYPLGLTEEELIQWRFLRHLDEKYVYDQDCHLCKNKVPAEGVVVTVEKYDRVDSYKHKSFRFLGKETEALDKGESDIETEESDAVEVIES